MARAEWTAALAVALFAVAAPARAGESVTWDPAPSAVFTAPPLVVYDSAHQRTLALWNRQVYAFDGAGWTPLGGALPFAPDAAAFDRARGVVVAVDSQSDIAEYDGAAWTTPASAAPVFPYGVVPALAYDEARGVLVEIGEVARRTTLFTLTFDGATWTKASPGAAPSARITTAMAYDRARKRVVLFGGIVDEVDRVALNDTWEFDGVTWTQVSPAASPTPRQASLAYDAARAKVVLFAGRSGGSSPAPLADTWEYDGVTWTQTAPSAHPQPRRAAPVAYDERLRRVVLVGGGSTPVTAGDVWLYWGYAGACASSDACDTADCDHRVCCAVTCGTCEQCDPNGKACVQVRGADDPDTCGGARTCDPSGACRGKPGQSCAAPTDCASGECTRGVCCARCAPYACGADGACGASCASDADCAPPAICTSGACAEPAGACTDATTSRSSDGAAHACAPYACDPRAGTCRTTCATSDDCADGFSCAHDATCTSAPPGSGRAAASCGAGAIAAAPASPVAALLGALVAVALGLARRARIR